MSLLRAFSAAFFWVVTWESMHGGATLWKSFLPLPSTGPSSLSQSIPTPLQAQDDPQSNNKQSLQLQMHNNLGANGRTSVLLPRLRSLPKYSLKAFPLMEMDLQLKSCKCIPSHNMFTLSWFLCSGTTDLSMFVWSICILTTGPLISCSVVQGTVHHQCICL